MAGALKQISHIPQYREAKSERMRTKCSASFPDFYTVQGLKPGNAAGMATARRLRLPTLTQASKTIPPDTPQSQADLDKTIEALFPG